jgi:hypothetical protein
VNQGDERKRTIDEVSKYQRWRQNWGFMMVSRISPEGACSSGNSKGPENQRICNEAFFHKGPWRHALGSVEGKVRKKGHFLPDTG